MSKNEALKRAQDKHDKKRSKQPRFGGRCSDDEKDQLTRLIKKTGIETEKELIFKALSHYEQYLNK